MASSDPLTGPFYYGGEVKPLKATRIKSGKKGDVFEALAARMFISCNGGDVLGQTPLIIQEAGAARLGDHRNGPREPAIVESSN